MLTVRLVAVALFGFVLGACVRNPIPVFAAGAPPSAAEDSARDRLPAGSGSWPWHCAASRTFGGGEAGGASIPRQWRGLRSRTQPRVVRRLALRVRRRYGLSVSPWEARVFEPVLRGCPVVVPAPVYGGGGVPW